MAQLGAPLAMPLGGEGLTGGKPWLVNMRPAPEDENVQLLRPISFSIRDTETFIDPTSLNIATGYARIYGRGKKFFDQEIANTKRAGLSNPLTNEEPIVSLIPNPSPTEAVRIKNVSGNIERSVYFTRVLVDDVRAYRNVMVSGLIKPVAVTSETAGGPYGYYGPVLGLELGPRNTSAMLFFRIVAGVKHILLTGPRNLNDNLPQVLVEYDWSLNQRYTLFWNESRGLVQVFGANNELITSAPITDFPAFDFSAPRHGDVSEYVLVYGIEGDVNDEVEISAVSLTDDVGFPLRGSMRPDSFTTFCRSAELVRTTPGVDPRRDQISPWYDDNSVHFETPDEKGVIRQMQQGLQMSRATQDVRSLAIYREEPGFLLANAEGFTVDLQFHGTSTARDGDSTGMGLVVCDGFNAWRLTCLQNGTTRYLGIRLLADSETALAGYNSAPYDWTVPGTLRFVVDGRAARVRIYRQPELDTPILDVPLNRALYPTPDDFGWLTLVPFIAVGHHAAVEATGAFYFRGACYSHLYRSWEAYDTKVPDDVSLSLVWIPDGTATPPVGPLTDALTITSGREDTLTYSRGAATDALRGAVIEARVAITGTDRFERSGDAIVLDDGIRRFILSFTETEEGKFVGLALRADVNDYQEVVGFDGDGAKLSTRVDWTKPHTYRLERKPLEGVFLFINNEAKPRIFWPESKIGQLPNTFYNDPTVAFGHFLNGCPSTAKWYFVRAFFSTGYEISFKKNKPDLYLKDQLFATESIVLVEAADSDPVVVPPECTGGIPMVTAGGAMAAPFNFTAESTFDFYVQFDWDAISHLGTQVKFHVSGWLDSTIGAEDAQLKFYIGGDQGTDPTEIDSFTVENAGKFYHLIGPIPIPSGEKKMRFTGICQPAGTITLHHGVIALEIT